MSKDKFPQLLKKLLVATGAKEGKNIRSGFRETEIYQFSPSEVLKTLPTDYGDESTAAASSANASVSEAFVDMLKTMRHGSGEGRKSMRRKKITVEPGCSVGSMNASSCQSAVVPVSSVEANKSNRMTSDDSGDDNSSSGSDGEESATSESSVECSAMMTVVRVIQSQVCHKRLKLQQNMGLQMMMNHLANVPEILFQPMLDLQERMQHSCCYYVGVVTKVFADKRYEVKSTRRSKMQKSLSFTFPDVEDFDTIERDRIIQKLTPNVDHRGSYILSDSTIRVPTCTQHIM